MKVYVPPIKCQGIKTKLVPWILSNAILPTEGLWLEPFMGSGVVGFNARPKRAIFNDLNPHLIAFYNAIKSSQVTPGIAREYLECEGEQLRKKGAEHYYYIRDRFNTKRDPLDFLFLSRAGFNGVIRFNSKGQFNVPFCKKQQRFSKAYITKIVNQINYVYQATQLYDWEFQCYDFRGLVRWARSVDFIYCDPPYFGRHVDYFDSWSEDDERALFEELCQTEARFVLSTWHSNKYRSNPNIDKYWSRFHILTKEHFYHIGAREINRNSMLEALVTNYEPISPTIEAAKKQLRLFEERASYTALRAVAR